MMRKENRRYFAQIISGINADSEAILERIGSRGFSKREIAIALVQLTKAVLVLARIQTYSEQENVEASHAPDANP